jgi:hypothetical protein
MIYILIFIIALQLADIVTTYLCLTRGKGTEGNGLLARLFARFGILPTLIVVKGAFIALLLWAAPQVPVAALGLVAAFYGWVVLNNVKVLCTKQKGVTNG